MDKYQHVRPGEPFRPTAAAWNAFADAARGYRDSRFGKSGGGPVPGVPVTPTLTVLIRNNTEDDYDVRNVVALAEPVLSAEEDPIGVQRRPAFDGVAPASSADVVAILQQPIPADGGIGLAVIAGLVLIQVEILDEDHDFAVPVEEETEHLASAESGPARLLWFAEPEDPPADPDVRLAVAILGGGSSAAGGGDSRPRLAAVIAGPGEDGEYTLRPITITEEGGEEFDTETEITAWPGRFGDPTAGENESYEPAVFVPWVGEDSPDAAERPTGRALYWLGADGQFEFLPIQAAAEGFAGIVSAIGQVFSGHKEFKDGLSSTVGLWPASGNNSGITSLEGIQFAGGTADFSTNSDYAPEFWKSTINVNVDTEEEITAPVSAMWLIAKGTSATDPNTTGIPAPPVPALGIGSWSIPVGIDFNMRSAGVIELAAAGGLVNGEWQWITSTPADNGGYIRFSDSGFDAAVFGISHTGRTMFIGVNPLPVELGQPIEGDLVGEVLPVTHYSQAWVPARVGTQVSVGGTPKTVQIPCPPEDQSAAYALLPIWDSRGTAPSGYIWLPFPSYDSENKLADAHNRYTLTALQSHENTPGQPPGLTGIEWREGWNGTILRTYPQGYDEEGNPIGDPALIFNGGWGGNPFAGGSPGNATSGIVRRLRFSAGILVGVEDETSGNPSGGPTPDGLSVLLTADPTSGMAPLAVDFEVEIFGGTGPYSVRFNSGVGADVVANGVLGYSTGALYSAWGQYVASVTVTDATGDSVGASIVIAVSSVATALTVDLTLDPSNGFVNGTTFSAEAEVSGGSGNYQVTFELRNGSTSHVLYIGSGFNDSGTVTIEMPALYAPSNFEGVWQIRASALDLSTGAIGSDTAFLQIAAAPTVPPSPPPPPPAGPPPPPPPPMTLSVVADPSTAEEDEEIDVTLTVSNGTGPYNFTWSLIKTSPGPEFVTSGSANGVSSPYVIENLTIAVAAEYTLFASVTDSTANGGAIATGSAGITVEPGSGGGGDYCITDFDVNLVESSPGEYTGGGYVLIDTGGGDWYLEGGVGLCGWNAYSWDGVSGCYEFFWDGGGNECPNVTVCPGACT